MACPLGYDGCPGTSIHGAMRGSNCDRARPIILVLEEHHRKLTDAKCDVDQIKGRWMGSSVEHQQSRPIGRHTAVLLDDLTQHGSPMVMLDRRQVVEFFFDVLRAAGVRAGVDTRRR